jgi:hypothetical protein
LSERRVRIDLELGAERVLRGHHGRGRHHAEADSYRECSPRSQDDPVPPS